MPELVDEKTRQEPVSSLVDQKKTEEGARQVVTFTRTLALQVGHQAPPDCGMESSPSKTARFQEYGW